MNLSFISYTTNKLKVVSSSVSISVVNTNIIRNSFGCTSIRCTNTRSINNSLVITICYHKPFDNFGRKESDEQYY